MMLQAWEEIIKLVNAVVDIIGPYGDTLRPWEKLPKKALVPIVSLLRSCG